MPEHRYPVEPEALAHAVEVLDLRCDADVCDADRVGLSPANDRPRPRWS